MSLREFVRAYRKVIDEHILKVCPNCAHFNDGEREEWVLNDMSLYSLAQDCGVRI